MTGPEPHVRSFTPSFVESVKLVRRPLLAFWALAGGGILAVVIAILSYNGSGNDLWQVPLFFGSGLLGVPVGQAISLLRLRTGVAAAVWMVVGVAFLVFAGMGGLPEWITVPVVLFGFGFASGFLSLQHRFELFAAFLPAVGWVGAVMVILNEEGRVQQWHDEKLSAWLPVPLLLLLLFVLSFGAYLLMKQTLHLELWQLLGGAPSRRLVHRGRAKVVVGGRALGAVLALGAALFIFTAVVSPYLWRTGRGDHDGGGGDGGSSSHDPKDDDGKPFDAEGLRKALEKFGEQAKEKSTWLLPLLPLFLIERPIRRFIVLRHLRRPFWRKGNTDRIEDLWRYVRVGVADAGIEPRPAESVEELVARVAKERGAPVPGLEEAAAIYTRTRYGLGVSPGSVERLVTLVIPAHGELRRPLTLWQRIKRAYARVD